MNNDMNNDKSFFRFEDLRVYHKAMDYAQWLNENSQSFSNKSFADEFGAKARQIAVQIAEGSARKKTQFSYYLKMAKSTTRECLVYTSLSCKYGFFDESAEEESRTQLIALTKMLGALIGSLQKPKNSRRNGNHNKDFEENDTLQFDDILDGDFENFDDLTN